LNHLRASDSDPAWAATLPDAVRAANGLLATVSFATICPSELAGHAVEMVWQRRRGASLPRSFIEKFVPEWDWLSR
jgi:hypothetical protein